MDRIEKEKEEYAVCMKEKKQRDKEEAAAEELKWQRKKWEEASKPHRDYIASRKPQPGPLTLQDLTGSWIVRGEKELAFAERGVLSLDVFPVKSAHGVVASFDFDSLSGTMLLGLSRRSVDLLREEQPKGDSDEEPADDLDESTQASFTGSTAAGPSTSRGRLVGTGSSVGQKRELGGVADPWGVQAAMAKRQKLKAEAQPQAASTSNMPAPRTKEPLAETLDESKSK